MNIPLRLFDNIDVFADLKEKGWGHTYRNHDKTLGLIFACPKCGYVSTGPHKYNKDTQTLAPSIKCGSCDYHGFLRNGFFVNS